MGKGTRQGGSEVPRLADCKSLTCGRSRGVDDQHHPSLLGVKRHTAHHPPRPSGAGTLRTIHQNGQTNRIISCRRLRFLRRIRTDLARWIRPHLGREEGLLLWLSVLNAGAGIVQTPSRRSHNGLKTDELLRAGTARHSRCSMLPPLPPNKQLWGQA